MAKTVKQAKADIYLRDTDSQSLFNNSGELSFKYFHEWNDCYNPTTGETAQMDGEVYDEETGAYKPNCPEGYIPVFNGRQSALWDNMVACFPDKIQEMYKKMRDNGLSYSDMFAKYKEFWRYWCENLYNADAFGYANTGNFEKAFGDKLQMMKYFFYKRQRYLDSKYCCGSSVDNHQRLRLSEVGKGLAIKYYQALYSSLQWGVGSFATQRNINPGSYSYMPFSLPNPQDATFDIDDADLITELSTYTKTSTGYTITGLEGLGNFKFDSSMGILKRLTKFVMNYTVAKPNTNELGAYFDLSGMTLLRQVIVRNVKNLTKSIVINSDMVEEIDFTNTPIVGVTTPPSDALVSLVLPATISSLKLKGYSNLTDKGLQVAGYGNVDEFEIEDCPNIDTFALLKTCYEAGAPLTEVTLKNVDWTLDELNMLLYLAQKKARLTGKITISEGVNLSLAQKLQLMSAWGDIDNKDNGLYIAYNMVEIKSVSVSGKSNIYERGDYAFKANTLPTTGNNAKEFYWSISENEFATISSDGVLTLNKVGSKENDDKATITLSVVLSDGSTKEASREVRFYKKDCELGDYVFADGTYATNLSDNEGSTPVGVVFYLEPVKRRWALAVALKNLPVSKIWGISPDSSSGFPDITLDDSTMNVYDIESLSNIITTEKEISDSALLDDTETGVDGFKVYNGDNALGAIGFTNTINFKNLLADYLDKAGLSEDDAVSRGMANTLKIIRHRDLILTNSAMNLPVPQATSNMTEEQSLDKCINDIVGSHENQSKYGQYYYPAASYCFAYMPSVKKDETISDAVSANRWFLPSIGELARIVFYQTHGYSSADKYAVFSQAYNDGKYVVLGSDNVLSSDEFSRLYCADIIPVQTQWNATPVIGNGIQKSASRTVRPCVAIKL